MTIRSIDSPVLVIPVAGLSDILPCTDVRQVGGMRVN